MKTTKKVVGVLVALAMLMNVFAMMSFAMTPDTAYELSITADKTSYNPGDMVTFTVSVETDASISEIRIDGTFAIGYNKSVLGAPTDGDLFELSGYNVIALQPGLDEGMSGMGVIEPTNIDEGHGWDAGLLLGIGSDATTFAADGKVDLFTFQMKVLDTAANGDYSVAFCKTSFENAESYFNDAFTFDPETAGVSTANVFAFNGTTVHVGAATEASFIKDGGAQIRFRGIGSTGTVADYKDEFDVRTVATISQDDFVANFGTDENAIAKITDIGFVYATAANVPTFDLATAKAVAEGTASEGYVKKAVQSIQHAGDGEVYKFTCLIENIADADKEQTVNALAYVCFDGTYYYFDAAATVDFAALYERMPK